MKKGDLKKENGFTIIETSLVLAIAGLIFLMVFIALPALQRSQRDSKRRDDVLLFLGAIKKYQTNNRGVLPDGDGSSWRNSLNSYLNSNFEDPDGESYEFIVETCQGNNGGDCTGYNEPDGIDHKLRIYKQATCNGSVPVKISNSRNVAVVYKLESGGSYCGNT